MYLCVGVLGEEGKGRGRMGSIIVAHCRYMETCGIGIVFVLRVSKGEGGGALREERTRRVLVIGNPTMKQV